MSDLAERTIRWGLSSTGRMADWFAKDFEFVDGGEIVAVASRDQARAESFAWQHKIERAHASFGDLLADEQVDVVYICSPHACHHDQVAAALEAGKAVVCEKPLTVDAHQCRSLIETSVRTRGYLLEAMWTYFLPAIQRARRWVDAGRIGAVRHVQADFGYPQVYQAKQREYDAELGGGALLEMGVYPVALARLFLPRTPERIQVSCRRAPNGVEDDLVTILDYAEDGEHPEAVARLATSFRCKLRNWAYIIGERGYIAIPDFWRAGECSLYELDTRVDHFTDRRRSQGFCFEAEAAQHDIRAGRRQSDVVPLATSLEIQELMAQIRELA